MINKRLLPARLLTTVMACTVILSCEQHPLPTTGDVVARVNGTPITEVDVDFASRSAIGGHQPEAPSADKKTVLDNIILQELAYQRATELGLDADPVYQKELRSLEAQINAFKRRKLSEMFFQREIVQKSRVDDDEARQYFAENTTRLQTELRVLQILQRDPRVIEKVRDDLAQGAAFEEVAKKQFPKLPDSERKPWDLGYLQWNQVPEVWRNVVDGMQVGDTSGIIRGPNHRYWIIKLIDKRVDPAITFEQTRSRIIDTLKHEKARRLREQVIQGLRDKARIVYSK